MLIRKILTLPIVGYQKWISPTMGPRCKYHPSCSQFTIDAIRIHGAKGLFLAIWRLLRCNPWSYGGVDYVPQYFPRFQFPHIRERVTKP